MGGFYTSPIVIPIGATAGVLYREVVRWWEGPLWEVPLYILVQACTSYNAHLNLYMHGLQHTLMGRRKFKLGVHVLRKKYERSKYVPNFLPVSIRLSPLSPQLGP